MKKVPKEKLRKVEKCHAYLLKNRKEYKKNQTNKVYLFHELFTLAYSICC